MPSARSHSTYNHVRERRNFFRVTINMLYPIAALAICYYGVFYWYVGLKEMVYIAAGLFASNGLAYFSFKSENFYIRFRLFILITYVAFFSKIIFTGGITSSVVPHLLFVPLLSLFYSKKRTVWLYFALTFLSIIVLVIVKDAHILPPSGIPPEYLYAFNLSNYVFVFVIVFFLAFLFRYEGARYSRSLERAFTELEETYRQLLHSEKLATIGQLTAGIAHEISNPVNFMQIGSSGLSRSFEDLRQYENLREQITDELKKITEKDANIRQVENVLVRIRNLEEFKKEISYDAILKEFSDILNSIQDGAAKTNQIIKGLRVFSRIDSLQYKPADIHYLINSTLLLLKGQYKNRITIIRKFADLPLVECNSGNINQVLMNLLSNAMQAIEKEGTVTITTRSDELNNKVCVEIKDSGNGIPEDLHDKIFDPFFTTKDVGEGTGLGLYISRGIMEDHDGELSFVNDLREGAVFRLELPISRKHTENNYISQ